MTNGIFCLESLWDNKDMGSTRTSVAPLIEFVGRSYGARHTTFSCGTAEELQLRLKKSRKTGYKILYLAGHGISGRFLVDGGIEVTLSQLAEMMGDRYYGWYVHFGSCSVLNIKVKEVKEFKHLTGAYKISGYKKPVDWAQSSALDLVWLSHLVAGEQFDYNLFGTLIRKLGFVYI